MPYDPLKSFPVGHHKLRYIIIDVAKYIQFPEEFLCSEVLYQLTRNISYLYWCK